MRIQIDLADARRLILGVSCNRNVTGERNKMKVGPLAIIIGVLISIYPVIILVVCTSGAALGGDAAIAYMTFAIIGMMLICTGLIVNELAKRNN